MPDSNFYLQLAQLLSQMAASRASGQATQASIDAQNNANATSRYQAIVNAARLRNIEQPEANARQMARGSLWSSWQPVTLTHPRATLVNVGGGPSVTQGMRDMGQSLMSSSLSRQQGGNPIDTSIFPSDASLGLTGSGSGGGSWIDSLLGAGTIGSAAYGLLRNAGIVGGPAAATTGTAGGAGAGMVSPHAATMANSIQGWDSAGDYMLNRNPHYGADSYDPVSLGGGGSRGSSRSPYQDLLMRQQLNDFGIGPDSYTGDVGTNLENTVADRLERARLRRLQRAAWR
jgi:hypothetical protein